jgi:hypothetical protein
MKLILSFVALVTLFSIASSTQQEDALNYVKNYYRKLESKNTFLASNSFICDECRSTLNDLKSTLNDKAKYEKLKNVIKMACSFTVGSTIEECKRTVDILDLYSNKLAAMVANAEFSCNQMLLCGTNAESPIGNKVLIMGLKAILRSTSVTNLESDQCDECVLVINTLYAILADSGVQKVLKYIATEVCTHIKSIPSDQCASLLDQYFPVAMNKIETFLADPIQVCTTFFVCRSSNNWRDVFTHKLSLKKFLSNNRHHRVLKVLNTLPRLQTKSGTDAGCLACEISITSAVAILNQPAILNEVTQQAITLICSKILPSAITPSCNDFLGQYLSPVLFMTINEWTPDQICTKFKACPIGSLQSFKAMTVQQQNTNVCDACQTVTSFLNNELQQPNFQQEVLSFVKSLVCSHSSSMEAQCSSLVDQYIPFIMQHICDYLSRNAMCTDLHLCPAV